MIFWKLVDFDLLWEVDLIEENDAVAVLRDFKELAVLISQRLTCIEDQEDQISFLEGFFRSFDTNLLNDVFGLTDPGRID